MPDMLSPQPPDAAPVAPTVLPLPSSGNNVLDEIRAAHANLSPPAKAALAQAGLGSPVVNPPAAQGIAQMRPMAPPAGPAPQMAPSPAQQNLQRLQSSPAGDRGIKNPVGRTLATIGDVALSTLLPGAAMLTPGTQLHHDVLLHQAQNAVTNEDALKNTATRRGLEQAQATEQASLPELHQTQADLAAQKARNANLLGQQKETDTRVNNEGKLTVEQQKANDLASRANRVNETNQRKLGMVPDEDNPGHFRPITDEEMTPVEQSASALKKANANYAKAHADYMEALATHQPDKIATTQKRLDLMSANLGLRNKEYMMHAYGTGADGAPLPGGAQTDTGQSVGTVNAHNVLPTGQEINKGDLAKSALAQVQTMRDIIKRKPGLFGPGDGRVSKLELGIGNSDPDALKYKAAQDYLAEHGAGVLGARSTHVLTSLEGLQDPHFNPASLNSALDEAEATFKPFADKGVRHTIGGSNEIKPTADPALKAYADKYFGGDIQKAKAHNNIK